MTTLAQKCAILANAPVFVLKTPLPSGRGQCLQGRRLADFFSVEAQRVLTDDLGSRIALDPFGARIPVGDMTFEITYYNQAAADFAGRRPKLGSDQRCVTWRLFWPDGTPMAHAECPMAVTLKEGRPIRGQEAVAERPDGTRVPFMPYPTPLFDGAGRLVGAVNLLMDITDQKRAQAEAQRMRSLLEDRVEHRTQALSDTAGRLKESEQTFQLLVQSVTDYAIFFPAAPVV